MTLYNPDLIIKTVNFMIGSKSRILSGWNIGTKINLKQRGIKIKSVQRSRSAHSSLFRREAWTKMEPK